MKTKIFIRLFFLGLFSTTFLSSLFAQNFTCGTVVTKQQMADDLVQIQNLHRGLFFPENCLGKQLSITAYIVRDSLGNPGITQATILNAIQLLNADFAPICLSFQICQFIYINNYNYDNYKFADHENEIYTLYATPNTINMYFVTNLVGPNGGDACGYAYFPGGRDLIVIKKGCTGSVKTISHEMGHFFGLYHTFETSLGAELINGGNCSTAGDLICDTPADPGGTNGSDCQMNPYLQDASGNWYVPQIGNIMSYYSDNCKCGFTSQQYNRIAQKFLTQRNYLW